MDMTKYTILIMAFWTGWVNARTPADHEPGILETRQRVEGLVWNGEHVGDTVIKHIMTAYHFGSLGFHPYMYNQNRAMPFVDKEGNGQ